MSTSNAIFTSPPTDTKPKASSAPTPSGKLAASRLSHGTKGFIHQMAENLRTHDSENPKGRFELV